MLAAIFGCQAGGAITVNIGEQRYKLPDHRVIQQANRSTSKSDSYGPLLLTWTTDEIRAAIPTFVSEAEDIKYTFDVQIYPGFDGDSAMKRDSYLLRGEFSGGTVEFDKSTGLYKVRRRIDRDRWDLLSAPPKPKDTDVQLISNLWVADCFKPAGFTHSLCRIETQYRGNNISVNLLAENLALRSEILAFIRRELDAAYRGE